MSDESDRIFSMLLARLDSSDRRVEELSREVSSLDRELNAEKVKNSEVRREIEARLANAEKDISLNQQQSGFLDSKIIQIVSFLAGAVALVVAIFKDKIT
jgi:replicative DNA helicase